MPIEIREISISMELLDSRGGADGAGEETARSADADEKAELVRACVEAVMRALRDGKEP